MSDRYTDFRLSIGFAGEWFTAHGKGINLGYFGKPENKQIAEKLTTVFAEWIDNGHNDFADENTVILCIRLTDGFCFHMVNDMSFSCYGLSEEKPKAMN